VHVPPSALASRLPLVALLAAAALVTAACGDGTGAADATAGRVRVVATTSVLGDFAREIGGDRVAVDVVIKPNVDAHDYEPVPSDIEEMRRAAVVLRNGAGLEAWFDDAIEASGTKAEVVDASDGVARRRDPHGDEDDPHVWHDPRNAITMVANVAGALRRADPDGAATYDANLADYTAQLRALDTEIEAETSALANKKLVTNHDAFGYYAARYGFEIVGSVIPSFDSSAEMSASDLDDIIAKIRAQGVRAIFSEATLPSKAAATIAKEAGVTVVEGDDALYGDSLGPAGSDAATYLAMMRHNTRTIVSNLR
jgi:ABC-type Zn uptake system ZnuABC Zn-binding protein ZnuA